MSNFTFEDYRKELKGAGPKLKDRILALAAEDPNIGLLEHMKLVDYAYPTPW